MRSLPTGTRYLRPRSVSDALAMKRDHPENGLFIAGGTDLIYNLKYGLGPEHPALIDLTTLPPGFRGTLFETDGEIRIGALTVLEMLEGGHLGHRLPALSEAVGLVAGPQHRQMGTIGGNVALDTRCWYYNQDQLWRKALGGCLKADGAICHVTGSKTRCVAARSGDSAAPLLLYGAEVEFHTLDGIGRMPIKDIFTGDGLFGPHMGLPKGAFIRNIIIPKQPEGFLTRYVKVAPRLAIDFSQLSLAIGARFVATGCEEVIIVISTVRPKPRVMRFSVEGDLSPDKIKEIAAKVGKGVKPLTNIRGDALFQQYRSHVAGVHVRRVLTELAATRS